MSNLLRRTGLCSSALVLALSLAACGGGDDSEPETKADEVTVLTEDEATAALLTIDDVGEGFTESGPSEEEDDSDLGCLSGINVLSDVENETEVENNFDQESDTALRSVLTGVNSYVDTATIEDAFADFRTSLEGCETVDVTEESGLNINLAVTVEDEPGLGEADDQIRLDGTGSIANQGQTYSYDLTFVASRIGNNLTVVGLIDVGAKGEDVIETLTETAVGNLADAIG